MACNTALHTGGLNCVEHNLPGPMPHPGPPGCRGPPPCMPGPIPVRKQRWRYGLGCLMTATTGLSDWTNTEDMCTASGFLLGRVGILPQEVAVETELGRCASINLSQQKQDQGKGVWTYISLFPAKSTEISEKPMEIYSIYNAPPSSAGTTGSNFSAGADGRWREWVRRRRAYQRAALPFPTPRDGRTEAFRSARRQSESEALCEGPHLGWLDRVPILASPKGLLLPSSINIGARRGLRVYVDPPIFLLV